MIQRSGWGTALFLGGAAGLLAVEFSGPLGLLALDRVFGVATPLWWGTFFLMMILGGRRLWFADHGPVGWSPTLPGQRFRFAVLFTRQDCPLCDEAKELLAHYTDYLPPVTEVDIDLDPALRQRLDTLVPVLELDGQARFKGVINEVLLRRLIEGTPPLPE